MGQYFKFLKKQCRIPLIIAVALVALSLVGTLAGSVIFRAKTYAELLPVEPGDFAAEVNEISYDQIPMLDKYSAERLGDRKLGELSDMVSQFEVVDDYTQINYKGRPVRIATLMYADLIKWFTNRGDGLPAYLLIDMVTQNVELVRLIGPSRGHQIHQRGALWPEPLPPSPIPLPYLHVRQPRNGGQ